MRALAFIKDHNLREDLTNFIETTDYKSRVNSYDAYQNTPSPLEKSERLLEKAPKMTMTTSTVSESTSAAGWATAGGYQGPTLKNQHHFQPHQQTFLLR